MPRIRLLLTSRSSSSLPVFSTIVKMYKQVVRRPNLDNEQSKSLTLAEKAREMRSREEEEKTSSKERKFETLASRAQRKRSPSPVAARQEGSRARSPQRKAGGPVFSRLGPKF